MRGPEADRARLLHILDAIGELENHAARVSPENLASDALFRFGIVKLIEVIGEAANMLSGSLRDRHPEVPWRLLIGMRNRLVHDYFRIDTIIVTEVVHVHILALKPQVQAILDGLPE